MVKNIMIADDEEKIRKLIAMYFRDGNFNIIEAEDGEEAVKLFKMYKIDIIILDIMIPKIDGFKVCEYIRKTSDVPIIMLTAKTQEDDKLKGFDSGTDEYVTKPFSPKVLAARVKSLLNRIDGKMGNEDIYEDGGLCINFTTGKVYADKRDILLTHKEFDLLTYMVKNRGMILSKESIINAVWGYDYYGDPRTVDTHIRRLRDKLMDKGKFIVTVRGRGYSFEVKNGNS